MTRLAACAAAPNRRMDLHRCAPLAKHLAGKEVRRSQRRHDGRRVLRAWPRLGDALPYGGDSCEFVIADAGPPKP